MRPSTRKCYEEEGRGTRKCYERQQLQSWRQQRSWLRQGLVKLPQEQLAVWQRRWRVWRHLEGGREGKNRRQMEGFRQQQLPNFETLYDLDQGSPNFF